MDRTALDHSICHTFEAQVARHGARIAIKGEGVELTYAGLNQAANRLADAVLSRNRPQQEPIAVVIEPGAAEIVALLGVLKAGHPYVALSPSSPADRLGRILDDSTPACS